MSQTHLITREIGIDMGHRVTHHGSKCKNLHGHRYIIQATCCGPLFIAGEQQGMVLDFGFLKDAMMLNIDVRYDHGTCLWKDDPWIPKFLSISQVTEMREHFENPGIFEWFTSDGTFGKLCVVDVVPTAENLARLWFNKLKDPVKGLSEGKATLDKIKVWETPNCSAEYSPGFIRTEDIVYGCEP